MNFSFFQMHMLTKTFYNLFIKCFSFAGTSEIALHPNNICKIDFSCIYRGIPQMENQLWQCENMEAPAEQKFIPWMFRRITTVTNFVENTGINCVHHSLRCSTTTYRFREIIANIVFRNKLCLDRSAIARRFRHQNNSQYDNCVFIAISLIAIFFYFFR